MKNNHSLKLLFFCFAFSLLVFNNYAQGKTRKTSATIKSTVECELCKVNIEKNLSKVKGVRKVNANYQQHQIEVVYNSRKISLAEIKKIISDLGYDADEVPANNRMNQLLKHRQQQNNSN
jgi:periplasmic mercuric ion binding protein